MSVRKWLLIIMLLFVRGISGKVLINELYYDHPGTDDGQEWIELYNSDTEGINLAGWVIEKAGGEFVHVYTFPEITIAGDGYLLVGEADVEGADLTTELAFQNGGSETDGVRIVSADSLWTDTVLYDTPNSNELEYDTGACGESFAPDVAPGNSLERMPDGEDSNSGSDWQECSNPSPGSENLINLDLEISEAEIYMTDSSYCLYTEIHNLSTNSVDNSVGTLDIYFNNEPFESLMLSGIEGGESLEYTLVLSEITFGYQQVKINLNSIYDSNIENNISGCSLLNGLSAICFNELMIKPSAGNEEWLEFMVDNAVDNLVDNLSITDAAGNEGTFGTSGLLSGYRVICAEPEALIANYELSEEQVIEIDQLPVMNNGGDTLYLLDEWGTILDSVEYGETAGSEAGISWERIIPWNINSEWGLCQSETGQTAGSANSIMCGMIDLALEFKGLREENGYLEHELSIINQGIELPEECYLKTSWENLSGDDTGSTTEYFCITADSLDVMLSTEEPEYGYYKYNYELQAEGDYNLSNNIAETSFNQGCLAWVINEIMYHPATDEPEWLELKRNTGSVGEESLKVIVDDDSCEITVTGEYVLITGSASDVEQMQDLYGNDLEIYEGLARLTDDGSEIGLKDTAGNEFEHFYYDPVWNQEIQGVSIERVNPLLPANSNNWGRSVSGCTPGRANSIYTELPTATNKLSISPGIFNPHQGEHTVITYQSRENLNLVKIEIYDLKGRLIRKVADQKYQGAEGYYFWDGRNENGNIVKIGIYIILFESSMSGNISVEKETVVVKR